jgi:nucleoside 2-deoxyribosyltransferase
MRWRDVRPSSGYWYDCSNCGTYFCSERAEVTLGHTCVEGRASLSHTVWSRVAQGERVYVQTTDVDRHAVADVPAPEEQLENLILYWGGEHGSEIGKVISNAPENLRAKLGSLTGADVQHVFNEALRRSLIEKKDRTSALSGTLTFEGWRYFRELERGHTKSTHAFMAMHYGDPEVTDFVNNVFRPAVAETGFTLKRLDDAPEAGVIDNRMRVEIRQSKFVIADLTHCNRGAYWEAGFAEGLGKPVIYTCEKSYFKAEKTHFDTNHCTTVLWDAAEPEKAAEQLKATIRNTFPIEAKMATEKGE